MVKTITKVTSRWDDQVGATAGWYCEAWDGDHLVTDSQKVSFPVSVDAYAWYEVDELRGALEEAFPGAKVVMSE